MFILQLSGYYIQLAENDLTLRKMTTKPSIIIWSILPKDVPVTCKSVFFTSCKIIKMVHYLLLLNTPEILQPPGFNLVVKSNETIRLKKNWGAANVMHLFRANNGCS